MSGLPPNPYETPTKEFDQFSDDIRKAMLISNREAKRDFASNIGPHHLLTAIVLEESGIGGQLLRKNGVAARELRKTRRKFRPKIEWFTLGKCPASSDTKRVLDRAINHAVENGQDYVCTCGVLMALLSDQKAVELLHELNVDIAVLEREVKSLLDLIPRTS